MPDEVREVRAAEAGREDSGRGYRPHQRKKACRPDGTYVPPHLRNGNGMSGREMGSWAEVSDVGEEMRGRKYRVYCMFCMLCISWYGSWSRNWSENGKDFFGAESKSSRHGYTCNTEVKIDTFFKHLVTHRWIVRTYLVHEGQVFAMVGVRCRRIFMRVPPQISLREFEVIQLDTNIAVINQTTHLVDPH